MIYDVTANFVLETGGSKGTVYEYGMWRGGDTLGISIASGVILHWVRGTRGSVFGAKRMGYTTFAICAWGLWRSLFVGMYLRTYLLT